MNLIKIFGVPKQAAAAAAAVAAAVAQAAVVQAAAGSEIGTHLQEQLIGTRDIRQ
jgi:hypothetical protein